MKWFFLIAIPSLLLLIFLNGCTAHLSSQLKNDFNQAVVLKPIAPITNKSKNQNQTVDLSTQDGLDFSLFWYAHQEYVVSSNLEIIYPQTKSKHTIYAYRDYVFLKEIRFSPQTGYVYALLKGAPVFSIGSYTPRVYVWDVKNKTLLGDYKIDL
jgi:uncharacterized protein YcfL